MCPHQLRKEMKEKRRKKGSEVQKKTSCRDDHIERERYRYDEDGSTDT